MARAEADGRLCAVGRSFVRAAWAGEFLDHRETGGCRIPARAEAAWMLDAGRFVGWRGTVTAYRAGCSACCPE